jgi:hypothetical protein
MNDAFRVDDQKGLSAGFEYGGERSIVNLTDHTCRWTRR